MIPSTSTHWRIVSSLLRSRLRTEDGGPVFEVVAEIAYVKDRVSDEGMFRERVAGLVAGQQPRRWRKSHSAIMRRSKLYAHSNCSST